MPKVFVSDAIGQERLVFSPAPAPGGQRPRGWKALSALYQASFAACGFEVEQVVRPEIYHTDRARQLRGVQAGDWHLAVKPIEHLRPFHGVPNVFVCDWPFPELSASILGGSPFFDQVRVLRMADAVLCCTGFTTRTLQQAGVERAITCPPHIPPHAAREAPDRRRDGRRFLCVVDGDHVSRQLGFAIEGFAQAAARRGDLRLAIRLQGGGESQAAQLRQRVAQAGASDETVSIVSDDGGAGPEELLAGADFLLCAHAAAGLHLPLAAAMLAGVPVASTIGGGTASFLPPNAAAPIATRSDTLDGDGEPIGRFMPLTSDVASAESVRDAVLAAAASDEAARTRMAENARRAAERHFGMPAFEAALARLAERLPARPR